MDWNTNVTVHLECCEVSLRIWRVARSLPEAAHQLLIAAHARPRALRRVAAPGLEGSKERIRIFKARQERNLRAGRCRVFQVMFRQARTSLVQYELEAAAIGQGLRAAVAIEDTIEGNIESRLAMPPVVYSKDLNHYYYNKKRRFSKEAIPVH